MRYLFITLIPLFFVACGGIPKPTFQINKVSEFRYKNDFNNSAYLPKGKKVCVLNVKNDLPKSKIVLEEFIKTNLQDKVGFSKSCVKADIYFKLYKNIDLPPQGREVLKLTLMQRKGKKVIADYTINFRYENKQNIDESDIVKEFSTIFLDKNRVFKD